jgi:hypothetical protein
MLLISEMSNPIDTLRKALNDPKLEDLPCICPAHNSELIRILRKLPSDAFVSEWRHGQGIVRYEYHVHMNGVGASLRDAFDKGAKGGYPTLTAVYSREELEKISQESEAGSGYPGESLQIHY